MSVNMTKDSKTLTVRWSHQNVTVTYNLTFAYTDQSHGALIVSGPVTARLNYEIIADRIITLSELRRVKRKDREQLISDLERELPACVSIL